MFNMVLQVSSNIRTENAKEKLISQSQQIKAICPVVLVTKKKLRDSANGSSHFWVSPRLKAYFGTMVSLKAAPGFIDPTGKDSLSPSACVILLTPILYL